MFWNTAVGAALWSHRVSDERKSESGVVVPKGFTVSLWDAGVEGSVKREAGAKSQTGLAFVPVDPTPSPFLGMIKGGEVAEDLGSSLEGPHFLQVLGSSTESLISEN